MWQVEALSKKTAVKTHFIVAFVVNESYGYTEFNRRFQWLTGRTAGSWEYIWEVWRAFLYWFKLYFLFCFSDWRSLCVVHSVAFSQVLLLLIYSLIKLNEFLQRGLWPCKHSSLFAADCHSINSPRDICQTCRAACLLFFFISEVCLHNAVVWIS